jgi:hypothetical protein
MDQLNFVFNLNLGFYQGFYFDYFLLDYVNFEIQASNYYYKVKIVYYFIFLPIRLVDNSFDEDLMNLKHFFLILVFSN